MIILSIFTEIPEQYHGAIAICLAPFLLFGIIRFIMWIYSKFKKKPPPPPEERFMTKHDTNKKILKHLGSAVDRHKDMNFGQILRMYRVIQYRKMKWGYAPIDPEQMSSKEILKQMEHDVNQIKINDKYEM